MCGSHYDNALRTLKVLLGWSRHELTDHSDRITEGWSCDGQVDEASDNLSEPGRVAYLSGVGTKLHSSVQRSRDGLTIGHPEFEEHTQHVMALLISMPSGVRITSIPRK